MIPPLYFYYLISIRRSKYDMIKMHISCLRCIYVSEKRQKTQNKAAVEDTVGKVVTDIIASLRNRKFNSFEKLYKTIKKD